MANFVKFHDFSRAVSQKEHNLSVGGDVLTVALSNTQPVASTAVELADITEIDYTNVSANRDITVSAGAQTGGTYALTVADKTMSASGGDSASFQYVVIYNSTSANDALLGYYDYGSSQPILDGQNFIIDFTDASNYLLTLA